MVSTRGNKYAFSSGERVLCYEPDPSKAKVLYDSKVLDVIVRKDERSKKYVEYLIHFQGWNSSWDRCVSEDYVLKDTEENRKLQKDLADKAQLQLGAYLYRRNRKKRTRTLSQKIIESSESGTNSGSSKKSQEDEVEEQELATTSEEDADEGDGDDEANDSSAGSDSSVDECIPIDLSEQMKYFLEEDYNLVHNKNKVVSLPAMPTVVEILEGYVKHFGQAQLREPGEPKRRTRGRYKEKKETDPTKDFEAVSARLNLCKEVVDGLRIYFDFTLGQLLLYDLEKSQYEEVKRGLREFKRENRIPEIKIEFGENTSEGEIGQNICQASSEAHELKTDADHAKSETERKRSLRSHREAVPFVEPSCSVSTLTVTPNNGTGKLTIKNLSSLSHMGVSHFSNNRESAMSTSSTSSYYSPLLRKVSINSSSLITNVKIAKLIDQNNSWKIAPQSYYDERPQHPATLYGAIHLARLFVKLPNLLYVANQPEKENHPRLLPERKLKALINHLQLFLTYLEGKKEWFGEKHYVDNCYNENEELM